MYYLDVKEWDKNEKKTISIILWVLEPLKVELQFRPFFAKTEGGGKLEKLTSFDAHYYFY